MLRETSTDLLLHNTKEAYKLTEVIILCNKAETLNQFLISFEKLLVFFYDFDGYVFRVALRPRQKLLFLGHFFAATADIVGALGN